LEQSVLEVLEVLLVPMLSKVVLDQEAHKVLEVLTLVLEPEVLLVQLVQEVLTLVLELEVLLVQLVLEVMMLLLVILAL